MPPTESSGVKIENEMKDHLAQVPPLEQNALVQLTFIKQRIQKAKDQRDQKLREFNGLDFLTDDQANRDIRNSFIRPKKNDDEVRVNTGMVEKKMMSVCNEILGLNMEPEIHVFDENDKPVQELGEVFSNLVTRTKEQEDADDLQFPALWDLATRRVLFLEEYQEEKYCVDKRKKKFDLETGDIEFETKEYKISRPRTRLLDSRSVLLGDMGIQNHRYNDQPFIIKYDRKNWRELYQTFHKFKNWKFVKKGAPATDASWYGGIFEWRLFATTEEDCEVLYYFSYPDDEMQIIINGVPMLPPNCPLDYEFEGYKIQAFVFREIENLAYGQLFTINAKVLAGVHDEMIRLIIRKWRKSIEPSIVVKGKKVLNRDVWGTGAIISGINPEDIKTLGENQGVTQSEMATLELISAKIENEIGVSKLFQGMTDKKMTATQTLEQMKQAIKAIGVLVLSWMKVIRVMTYLRIYNIIENNTDPIDVKYENGEVEKIFRNFTVSNTKLDDETTGTMMIEFTDKDMPPEYNKAVYDYEEEQKKRGNNVRYKRINVDKLRQFRFHWYVTVTPQEKESTALQKIMFTDQLNQGAAISQITGRKIAADSVVQHFERVWKAKNFFEKAPNPELLALQKQKMMEEAGMDTTTVPPEIAEMAGSMGNTPMGGEMESAISGAVKRPSINSATSGVK